MSSLKDLIAKIFPEECIIDGTSYSEKGKCFSLRPSHNEEVVLIKIDNDHNDPCQYFKEINPKYDLLCICKIDSRFFILFIELKGSDIKYALKQINNTFNYFCYDPNKSNYHPKKDFPLSHEKKIYGIIISVQGLSLKQKEKKKLRKKQSQSKKKEKISFKRFKPQEIKGWTCSQLLKKF